MQQKQLIRQASWNDLRDYLMERLQNAERRERIAIPTIVEKYISVLLSNGYYKSERAARVLHTHPQSVRSTFSYLKLFADYLVYNGTFMHDKLLRPWREKAREAYDGAYEIGRKRLKLPVKKIFVFAILAEDLPKYEPVLDNVREDVFSAGGRIAAES